MTTGSPTGRSAWTTPVVGLLVAMFANTAAYAAAGTALGIQVFGLTHRELDLGLLGMVQFAPGALLLLVTGAVADRYDRGLICSLSSAAQGFVALALAGYAALDPTDAAPIFGLVFVFGAARSFFSSAQGPLPADIVAAEFLPRLMARRTLVSRMGLIVGPILAGLLYEVETAFAYIAVAGLFALAAGGLSFTRSARIARARPDLIDVALDQAVPRSLSADTEVGPPRGRARLHDALEGYRFIRRTPILYGAISLDLFATLFGGAVALLPAIAEDRLGVGPSGLGLLRAAAGVGSGIAILLLVWRPLQRRIGRALLLSIATFGVGTIALGVTTDFAVALVAMAVLAGADSVNVFIRSTLVPLATPKAVRGRVAAIASVFVGASNELGAFESGVAGQLLGSSGAVVLGGGATLAVVGAWAVAFPALRELDRFPDPGDAEGAER